MNLAKKLVTQLQHKNWHLRCVESCTAGGLTAAIGAISGASTVLDRSWVTYSNQAKIEEVGVSANMINTYGAISKETVAAMAEGASKDCERNTVSISISGIAGPNGGTKEKPVGTVWIGVKVPHMATQTQCFLFSGTRKKIQNQAITAALDLTLKQLASV